MSVQNESLELKPAERKPEAPELEYKAATHDSLSMFFAAVGGAVLGMLATLLVLALINGGTLNFVQPERLAVLETNLSRVDQNLGVVSQNLDTVATQVTSVRNDMAGAAAQVDTALAQMQEQSATLAGLGTAVSTLEVTGRQFDSFIGALDEALTSIKKLDSTAAPAAEASSAAENAAPAAVTQSAPADVVLAAPLIAPDPSVAADAIAVLFFTDADANGKLDDAETVLPGLSVVVLDAAGKQVAQATSDDSGALVKGLKPGAYEVKADDLAGHTLDSADAAAVTVAEDAQEGQIVYFPVAQ
jgi:hypothetical protein